VWNQLVEAFPAGVNLSRSPISNEARLADVARKMGEEVGELLPCLQK
jgi:hypothetical protein